MSRNDHITPPKSKRLVASAVAAAMMTAVAGVGLYSLIHNIVARWIAFAVFTPALPAWFVLLLVPVGPRVDGIPIPPPIAILVVTFALWWVVLYLVFAWYRGESV